MDKQLYSNDVLRHVLTTAAKSDVMQEAIIVMAVLEVEGIFAVPSRPSQSDKKIIVGELIARLLLAKQAGSDKRFAGQYTPSSLENLPRWMKKTSDGSYQVDISYNSGCHKLFDRHINTEAGIMGLLRDWWGGFSNSDFVAVVRAVRAFHAINRELRFGTSELESRELQKWCDRHLLVYRKLCAIYREIHYISEAMKKMNLQSPNELLRERDFDGSALTKSLAAGLTDGISSLMLSSTGGLAYQSSSGDDFWVAHASCVSRMRNCDLILAANLRTINSQNRELTLANLAAPLKPEWVLEVRPDLTHEKWLDDCELLPRRDEEVQTIIAENPGAITVQGEEFTVQYHDDPVVEPLISVCLLGDAGKYEWVMCLEDEIRLPSGRLVAISLRSTYGQIIYCSSNIESVKREATNFMNWQQFRAYRDWPKSASPSLEGDDAEIGPLVEHQYGTDAYYNAPLIAYGIEFLDWEYYRNKKPKLIAAVQDLSATGNFLHGWFYHRPDAEAARERAIAKLEKLKDARRQEQKRNELAAAPVKYSAIAAGTVHNTSADAFVVLHDFGGVYKNGTGSSNRHRAIRLQDRSYYWVIERNGVQRKPDRNTSMIAAVGDGVMMWDYVLDEELALQLLGGKCKVMHRPARLLPQQVAAVRRIETEIGVPDAFALNRAPAADTTAARRCG